MHFSSSLWRRLTGKAAVPAQLLSPQMEPVAELPSVHIPLPVRGLTWGGYLFRFDYDYTPSSRALESGPAGRQLAARIRRDETQIRQAIADIAAYAEAMARIVIEPDPTDVSQPCWNNGGWLPSLDAAMIYTLIARHRPAAYFEVGSGNSTKFARRAIADHGLATQIVSIDPHPRAEVDALCDEVIREPVESIDINALAARVRPGDVVFVDNSHRGFQGSDVTVCLMELMPALPAGTFVGVHDICLPYDYDPCFIDYFYNEQYFLGMYLLGGALTDRVVMPTYFLSRDPPLNAALLQAIAPLKLPEAMVGGSAFWLQLGPRPEMTQPTLGTSQHSG